MAIDREDGVLYDVLKVNTLSGQTLSTSSPLNIPKSDHVALTYDASGNITTATYKKGGSSGTTVATLTMTYSGTSMLTCSVTY